jgi:DNA invertase Pin-like site-specific DNA recombinase
VSTADQTSGLEAQVRTLKEFCEKHQITNFELFADENQSGAKASRPSLDRMMAAVRNGEIDKVVVYSFSRFARSTTHLLGALEEFRRVNVSFISYTEQIDTNSPMGRAFFTVIAAIAQLERELIVERVKNGLRNAKAKGKHIGRKKTRNSSLIRALLMKKIPYRKIAEIANCSHGSIYCEAVELRRETEAAKNQPVVEQTGGQFFPEAASIGEPAPLPA